MYYLLGFKEKLQILLTKSGSSALHGAEASPISITALTSLRTAFCAAAWSSKMPPAKTGALLSMLDVPEGCEPAFQVIWAKFRTSRMRKFVLGMAVSSYLWSDGVQTWARLGLPQLHILAGPIQHVQNILCDAWVCQSCLRNLLERRFAFLRSCCLSAAPCLISCQGTRQRTT